MKDYITVIIPKTIQKKQIDSLPKEIKKSFFLTYLSIVNGDISKLRKLHGMERSFTVTFRHSYRMILLRKSATLYKVTWVSHRKDAYNKSLELKQINF
ncbi:MAG: hypothetical protein C4617_05825 [Candidatus Liberibacter europaeus]|uniref:Uncharacterized protein n=1 Tax=Candidatus Liberibacter europaeus TaxID=744859 RepID=A0A2T4VWB6_9HYPH|nr:hypothetical protein [Candidatus Liberibacter europaeus]PTL86069.1 MAG: hypothetical protein C4617_05825 [Candidatus Liberibacter europaeus]